MRINFAIFLNQSSTTHFVLPDVLCFIGDTYSASFFVQLRDQIQQKYKNLPVESIDVKNTDWALLQSRLQTSFLGQNAFYFLHGFSGLNRKKQADLFAYLYTYRGPNKICFFSTEDDQCKPGKNWIVVDVRLPINKKLFSALIVWYGIPLSRRIRDFIAQLFAHCNSVSLQKACLLIHYMLLIGSDTSIFFNDWIESIVASDQSLFLLSQSFFEKNTHDFFEQWRKISAVYSPQFWVSFWSDQLWRASMFVSLQRKKEYPQARKIAFRLPFSFINRSWKNCSTKELDNAHHFVYTLDYRLKHGGDTCALDLFYSSFFLGNFDRAQ